MTFHLVAPAPVALPGLPVGYAVAVGVASCCTLAALTSRRPGGPLASVQYLTGFVVNELPVLAGYWLAAVTLLAAAQGNLRGPAAWVVVAVAIAALATLVRLAARARAADFVIDRALDEGLGAQWRAVVGAPSASEWTPRLQRARRFLWPVLVRRRDVSRLAWIRYGDAGRANTLDLYRSRRPPSVPGELRPVLVHLHGGALVRGRKNREGLPLIYRLASRGWVW